MTIDLRKTEIIKKIKVVNEDWILTSIEKLLSGVGREDNELNERELMNDYLHYLGNIEEKLDLEKIKKERPLKKLNMERFSELADDLEWDQSIEELLEDLRS